MRGAVNAACNYKPLNVPNDRVVLQQKLIAPRQLWNLSIMVSGQPMGTNSTNALCVLQSVSILCSHISSSKYTSNYDDAIGTPGYGFKHHQW